MSDGEHDYCLCGVYCGQCPSGNGRIRFAAGELKCLIDTTRFEWMEDVVKSFRFSEYRKGLEWFSQAQCQECHEGGGAPCENRPCAKEMGLKSCLLCGYYMTYVLKLSTIVRYTPSLSTTTIGLRRWDLRDTSRKRRRKRGQAST